MYRKRYKCSTHNFLHTYIIIDNEDNPRLVTLQADRPGGICLSK